ncbi:MAG: hypothetical protein JWP90_972 [Mycetocola sp.]|nr:hypothetical protein [Mycetocola sp.]
MREVMKIPGAGSNEHSCATLGDKTISRPVGPTWLLHGFSLVASAVMLVMLVMLRRYTSSERYWPIRSRNVT